MFAAGLYDRRPVAVQLPLVYVGELGVIAVDERGAVVLLSVMTLRLLKDDPHVRWDYAIQRAEVGRLDALARVADVSAGVVPVA